LLQVRGLTKHFVRKSLGQRHVTKAVDGVDLDIEAGQTLSLVGESGSGKTTLGRMVMHLLPATSGTVLYRDVDIFKLKSDGLKALRREMQIVFQNPYGALDPRQSIESIIEEPLIIHGVKDAAERSRTVTRLLDMVGMPAAARQRYPHQFSGGQRQRVGIARALALNPSFIVCDEPVSALDVSIKAQIINLLLQLQKELNLTYLFISHDLSVVRHISDQVAVMYLGQLVELAPSIDLYREPLHPYTEALLAAAPIPDPSRARREVTLKGDIALGAAGGGCRFRQRCEFAVAACSEEPPWQQWRPGRWARCWRIEEIRSPSAISTSAPVVQPCGLGAG